MLSKFFSFLYRDIQFNKAKEFFVKLAKTEINLKILPKYGNLGSHLKASKSSLIGLALAFFVFGFSAGIFCLTSFVDYSGNISQPLKQWILMLKGEGQNSQKNTKQTQPGFSNYDPQTSQEQAIINVVKKASPAVVSIMITKEVPIMEDYIDTQPLKGDNLPFDIQIEVPRQRESGATEKKRIGAGSGFIVSEDGMIITNKHVVLDKEANYTIVMSDGKKYPARVMALDPLLDLAVLKIDQETSIAGDGNIRKQTFPTLKLGTANSLQIGQTVIVIGNALGEFRNTVSVGVISGLARSLSATDGAITETLEDVIQTDAAINKGNSGGPLLNLKGEVIGVNTAMAEASQSIGFSIQIDKAKRDVDQVRQQGKIVYPFLGLVYLQINDDLQEEKKLPVNYGAYVPKENGKYSIVKDSAAEKSGLKELDIILEVDNEKIQGDNSLSKIIKRHFPGDEVKLKVLRDKKEIILDAVLGEITSDKDILK